MAEAVKYKKEYIEVEVHFAADGTMLPRVIEWEDGHKYEIDRVLKIQPAPAMKAGGQGDRYTVMIGGQLRSAQLPFLYHESAADRERSLQLPFLMHGLRFLLVFCIVRYLKN